MTPQLPENLATAMAVERETQADTYEEQFHRDYPEGMTVADYCNSEVPATCFSAGWDAGATALFRKLTEGGGEHGLPVWLIPHKPEPGAIFEAHSSHTTATYTQRYPEQQQYIPATLLAEARAQAAADLGTAFADRDQARGARDAAREELEKYNESYASTIRSIQGERDAAREEVAALQKALEFYGALEESYGNGTMAKIHSVYARPTPAERAALAPAAKEARDAE